MERWAQRGEMICPVSHSQLVASFPIPSLVFSPWHIHRGSLYPPTHFFAKRLVYAEKGNKGV